MFLRRTLYRACRFQKCVSHIQLEFDRRASSVVFSCQLLDNVRQADLVVWYLIGQVEHMPKSYRRRKDALEYFAFAVFSEFGNVNLLLMREQLKRANPVQVDQQGLVANGRCVSSASGHPLSETLFDSVANGSARSTSARSSSG